MPVGTGARRARLSKAHRALCRLRCGASLWITPIPGLPFAYPGPPRRRGGENPRTVKLEAQTPGEAGRAGAISKSLLSLIGGHDHHGLAFLISGLSHCPSEAPPSSVECSQAPEFFGSSCPAGKEGSERHVVNSLFLKGVFVHCPEVHWGRLPTQNRGLGSRVGRIPVGQSLLLFSLASSSGWGGSP